MLYAILSIVVAASVAALGWLFLRQLRVVLHTIPDPQPLDTPSTEPMWEGLRENASKIDTLERQIVDLFQAVADGIDHVDRNEKRVRGIVLGAKRRFEAEGYVDPGVDAEAGTLPLFDEGGSAPEGLPPLPNDVEVQEHSFQGIPGNVPAGFLDGN